MRHHCVLVKMAKIWNTDPTKNRWDWSNRNSHSSLPDGMWNSMATLEDSLVVSHKTKCIHYPPQLLCFMWLLPPIVFTVVKYTSYKMYYLKLWCARVCVLSCFSCVWLFATLLTVALQNPPSMEFSSQEYWSELPCPPPGDLLDVQSSDTKYIDNVVQPSPSSIFITPLCHLITPPPSSYKTETLYPLLMTFWSTSPQPLSNIILHSFMILTP